MVLTKLKQIIVLSGRPNSGKTAILNALCDKVLVSKFMTAHNPAEQESGRSRTGDQRFTAQYHGNKLAICTAGDTADHIFKSFLYAEKWNVEVLVLALSIPPRSSSYKTAEEAFKAIVRLHRLSSLVDQSDVTTYAPPKPKGYVDTVKVSDLFKKI